MEIFCDEVWNVGTDNDYGKWLNGSQQIWEFASHMDWSRNSPQVDKNFPPRPRWTGVSKLWMVCALRWLAPLLDCSLLCSLNIWDRLRTLNRISRYWKWMDWTMVTNTNSTERCCWGHLGSVYHYHLKGREKWSLSHNWTCICVSLLVIITKLF